MDLVGLGGVHLHHILPPRQILQKVDSHRLESFLG